jgi:hypothetical protein
VYAFAEEPAQSKKVCGVFRRLSLDGSSASCPFVVQVFVLNQLQACAKADMQELEIPTAQQLTKTARPLELPARRGTEKVSLGEASRLAESYDTMVTLS